MWTGLVKLRIGTVKSSCEFGIEPLGFIKCWETNEWHTSRLHLE
jgi:hypothetical protein